MMIKSPAQERKRKQIVKDYFKTWKWWFLSVIACLVLVSFSNFVMSSTLTDFSILILISLMIMYLVLMLLPLHCFFRMGPGLLSMSTILMWLMSLAGIEPGLDFLMKLMIMASVMILSLDVLLGFNLTFHIKVKERSWSFQERRE